MRLLLIVLLITFSKNGFTGQGSDKCFKSLDQLMEPSTIYRKIGLPNINEATFEQRANLETASDEDKPWIQKYADGSNICRSLEIDEIPKDVHDGYANIFKSNEDKKQFLLIDLYNRKITYGKYIQLRKSQIEQMIAEKRELDMEISNNQQVAKSQEKTANSRSLADFFGGMSRAFAPRGSVNCSSNGTGGQTCYKN